MKLSVVCEHLLYVGNIRRGETAAIGIRVRMRDAGNSRALRDLYSLHAPSLGRLAYLLVSDRDLAEDMVNETFIRVARHLWKLRDPRIIESYLRRTLINLARAHGRKQRREQQAIARVTSGREQATYPETTDYVEHRRLIEALNKLPYRQKAALLLRYYEDLSEHQVAEILHLPVGTVKTLVFRGKERLRVNLGDRS